MLALAGDPGRAEALAAQSIEEDRRRGAALSRDEMVREALTEIPGAFGMC